ncbi:MAG: indolepyruvate ferredoxin oxidoreductase family protein [Pseudomonadales bacterium]|jgi:indolepyruvate ferredoxin oxidoreductase|nr:indolepyruvate ferredoxin oxidoreductase family protein [Pseudomonadales bacterium]MDP7143964.1 indolepyruvate ferredoxin oxidoreductase family protein [Pseudomonadales bacterium]
MTRFDVSLDDKFDLSKNRVYMTGTQALVRLCLEQSARDTAAGFRTGGYVTGYRGSPLGNVDFQFHAAQKHLAPSNVVFEEGLNEDLAATALWGTQQAELRGEGKFDGVFGLWYGKGPGVDRSGDALRHANLAGSSALGGVLLLMGDDHTCESSTTAHQSEYALVDAQIPILNPATVADILEFGLHGWALSRFAGVWCGIKAVKENIESSGTVETDLSHINPQIPTDFDLPEAGLNIRLDDHPTVQETRLHRYKMDAVRAYVRANSMDKVTISGGEAPALGIITAGKSYLDVLQALAELGIDDAVAKSLGVTVLKLAMTWPLEPKRIRDFARGLNQIIVVEEKRGLIEDQLRTILYSSPERPDIVGKKTEQGHLLFPAELALNPVHIASEIGARLPASTDAVTGTISARLQDINARLKDERADLPVARGLGFCAGCPHNTSTKAPEGARSFAGIGCHYMAQVMDRGVQGYTHMGAEGSNWIGEARFSNRDHVYQNLGDGTFNHSGLQAVRASIAAGVNITYKLLYNDAVALTGGQANDGGLDSYTIAAELAAAGVSRMAYVTEEPARIEQARLPRGVALFHRRDLMQVQEDMARVTGTTVVLYDQTCAAENRRRRKHGLAPDVDKRIYINPSVCEGCGDCGVQSNCVAIQPLETDLGRKREIDQSACNKDFSCLDGFCPSFVTVNGAVLRVQEVSLTDLPEVPEPVTRPSFDAPYSILVNGIGGTGVVTVGALIGMAAHLEGRAAGLIDMAGLAQKGGSVFSHIKLARSPAEINAIRVGSGGADLLLGCDLLISATNASLSTLNQRSSHAVINSHEQMPGEFARQRDFHLPLTLMQQRIETAVPAGHFACVNATQIARQLLGDSIGANLIMLGVAYQLGLLPLSADALLRAIDLNAVAIPLNKKAFALGRQWVHSPEVVLALLPEAAPLEPPSLDEMIADRTKRLIDYQSADYAARYSDLVALARNTNDEIARAVAQYFYKLMAYKDEYEVARLYSTDSFRVDLAQTFSDVGKLQFHLVPPLLVRLDPVTGKARKITMGPWILPVFRLLAKGKHLRGTTFDPFGYTLERRTERRLISDYEALVTEVADNFEAVDQDAALALAELPDQIRGFGHVKLASIEGIQETQTALTKALYCRVEESS